MKQASTSARPTAIRSAVLGLAVASSALHAGAQTMQVQDNWQFELTPYLWLAGIDSNLKLGPLPQDSVNVSSTNVLKSLDMAAMGTFDARKGSWGGIVDAFYANLGASKDIAGGLAGGVDAQLKQQIWTLAGYYRAIDTPGGQLDVVAGARYVHANTSVDRWTGPFGPTQHFDASLGWWNGIVGVRGRLPLNDKWALTGYADVGNGGSGISTWQALAGASYQYSPSVSMKFGYRYLSFKRDDALLQKVALLGFYAGVGFAF